MSSASLPVDLYGSGRSLPPAPVEGVGEGLEGRGEGLDFMLDGGAGCVVGTFVGIGDGCEAALWTRASLVSDLGSLGMARGAGKR